MRQAEDMTWFNETLKNKLIFPLGEQEIFTPSAN